MHSDIEETEQNLLKLQAIGSFITFRATVNRRRDKMMQPYEYQTPGASSRDVACTWGIAAICVASLLVLSLI